MPSPTTFLLAFFALIGPVAAMAAPIVVDTTDDVVADDGSCSLREAILAANQGTSVDTCVAGDGEDEILLPAGTFAFAPNDGVGSYGYVIESPVVIRGAGAELTILDGMLLDRLFDVAPEGSLHLFDLTIANGKPPAQTEDEQVGADGGAIRALGDLRIERCVLSDNKAGTGGPFARGGHGGAICSTASMTVLDSRLQGNVSGDGGEPGSMAYVGPGSGGAIYATGPLSIERTVIEGNHLGNVRIGAIGAFDGDEGGAAIHAGGSLILRDVAITSNGKRLRRSPQGTVRAEGEFRISRTSFIGNEAEEGSALYSTAQDGWLTNVTVYRNQARPSGSALHVDSGNVRIQGATITANQGGGVRTVSNSEIALFNSILAENPAYILAPSGDCLGGVDKVVTSYAPNLFSPNSSCPSSPANLVSDYLGLEPLTVGPDGIVSYLPLERSSRAVDAGSCNGREQHAVDPLTEDIRGVSRPQGETCDIGAYEYSEPQWQTRTSAESASEECPYGGVRVELGRDRNFDGRLDDDEVESSVLICHGAPGEDGDPGETGEKGDKGEPGEGGEPGKDGVSCTVEHDDDGNVELRCDDGTKVTLPARGEGTSCTVKNTSQGGAKVICPDGSTATVTAPESGGCTTAAGQVSLLGLLGAAWALSRRPSGRREA